LFLDLAERAFDGEEFRGSAARAIERLIRRNVVIDDRVVAVLEGWLETPAPADPDEKTLAKREHDETAADPPPESVDKADWEAQG